MKLTEKTYHSIKNRYITNSRIGDFLECKKRFHDKHVSGIYVADPTGPMILGSAVDSIVTGSMAKFNKLFYTADLRKKDEFEQPGKTRLTKQAYEDAINIANKLLSQSAIKELKKHRSQVILTHDTKIGDHFDGYAAMLDWLGFDPSGETAYITDLKTGGLPTAKQWYYKCIDFGYFRQAGMFALLVKFNFPNVKNIIFRHICVEKDSDAIYNCYTYIIDSYTVDVEMNKILSIYTPMIAAEKEFSANDAKWNEAVTVGYGLEF